MLTKPLFVGWMPYESALTCLPAVFITSVLIVSCQKMRVQFFAEGTHACRGVIPPQGQSRGSPRNHPHALRSKRRGGSMACTAPFSLVTTTEAPLQSELRPNTTLKAGYIQLKSCAHGCHINSQMLNECTSRKEAGSYLLSLRVEEEGEEDGVAVVIRTCWDEEARPRCQQAGKAQQETDHNDLQTHTESGNGLMFAHARAAEQAMKLSRPERGVECSKGSSTRIEVLSESCSTSECYR